MKAITTPVVLGLEGGAEPRELLQSRALRLVHRLYGDWKTIKPGLKGSIGEEPNHSNFSDQSSVKIVSEFRIVC